ncbi:ABC transporter substrate-binding protein [Saccharothrix variisporea]|uniref:Cellobiose transport system substrate-binding protein n=1 Tax=Saccharothrix variisporea TaxID=543527 RepID=A0A495X076_9PSEU|nr:ABC transporter substrate-binding protein [Saccharothrix variisporea]RKT67217.1 cellobiose transport system substrate-binding protein [Saccharothrix variisporea]
MRRTGPLVGAGLLVASLVAGCGGVGDGKTRITIGLFGNFGYQQLFEEYERAHPDIDITDRTASYSDHHKNLAAHLATNNGAADIEAVDTGYINQFKQNPDKFVALDQGLKDQWLAWKWEASLAKNGTQIGYGTDVGGLAICYRRDLFEKAGLPAERDAVSASWPTWEKFFETGRRFQASAPQGVKFFDGGPTVLNAIVGQAPVGYYDPSDRIVVGENADLRKGWNLVTAAVADGLSAGLLFSTPQWNTGIKQGQFATMACPAWQMAKIKDQAPDTKGLWDLALVPGGGGNWGGSYLTVPKQGKNVEKAHELAKWLTAPEQQAKVFATAGLLPSTPKVYGEQSINQLTSEFFNNAPVGKVFIEAARNLRPQYQGPKAGDIQTELGNAMQRVEQGKQSADESWAQFVGDAGRLAG